MTTWRRIESAPKDGTDIIVYRPNAKENENIPMIGIDYWSKRLGNVWAKSNDIKQPTHWMPLPFAPKERDNGER